MIVAEVVETKMAFKPNQKDRYGNSLPIGSIEIRIGSHDTNLGQVRNVYARPAFWNRRIPLIGEQVMIMLAPGNDETTDGISGQSFMYFSPLNSTDDLVLHQFPFLFTRDQEKKLPPPGQRKADQKSPGYTFPKSPKKTDSLQPFEGDDLFEGRFGQSIRFGSSVVGDMSVYDKKPTWKGTSNTDPIIIMRVKKPSGSGNSSIGQVGSQFKSTAKYTIEDFGDDDASIYISTTQMLNKFKAGFDKNLDTKIMGNWQGKSQIIVDAERVIINAKKDKAFLIGAKQVVVTGKTVLFQSDKYKVDLDDLMDFLKKWLGYDSDLASAKAMYSTACGPTSVATNMAQFIQLQTVDFTKFKMP